MFTQLAFEFNKNPQLDDDQGYEQIPTVKCPFDASHMMQPKKFLTHVYSCKSPNKHLYVQCRYDPCHWFYPEEKQKHHQQCPTRLQHYLDLDLEQGDWDDEQIRKKMLKKAEKEQHNRRKQKILKIIAYLKKKKQLEKQMKLNPNKKYTKTISRAKQNESDEFTTYTELKQKLIKFAGKNKESSSTSKDESILNFDYKEIQPNNYNNGTLDFMGNNLQYPHQYMYPPMIPTSHMMQVPANPYNFQLYPISSHLGFQSNQITYTPFQAWSGANFRPQYSQVYPQNQFPYMNQPFQVYPYQSQPWEQQHQAVSRSKPKPQDTLKLQINHNSESFFQKKITHGQDSRCEKSDTKTKVDSQFDNNSFLISEKYSDFKPVIEDHKIKSQNQKPRAKKESKQDMKKERKDPQSVKHSKKSRSKKHKKIKQKSSSKSSSSYNSSKVKDKKKRKGQKESKQIKQSKLKPTGNQLLKKSQKKNQELKMQQPQFERILEDSISKYDFQPINFSMNSTIKNESFRMKNEKSQDCMDMQEMLSALNESKPKQKYIQKKIDLRFSEKRRDFGNY